jgi:hypothetical protein
MKEGRGGGGEGDEEGDGLVGYTYRVRVCSVPNNIDTNEQKKTFDLSSSTR